MDSYEVDLFLMCFIGGFCGGGCLMLILRYHWQIIYRKYSSAKNTVADIAALRRVEFEIEQLKSKISDLDKEVYSGHKKKPK